jgi:hypothetical protein
MVIQSKPVKITQILLYYDKRYKNTIKHKIILKPDVLESIAVIYIFLTHSCS